MQSQGAVKEVTTIKIYVGLSWISNIPHRATGYANQERWDYHTMRPL